MEPDVPNYFCCRAIDKVQVDTFLYLRTKHWIRVADSVINSNVIGIKKVDNYYLIDR